MIRLTTLFGGGLWLALLGVVGMAALFYRQDIGQYWAQASDSEQASLALTRRNLVYRLDTDRPTRFAVAPSAPLVRVVTTPAIAPSAPIAAQGWAYGIRVKKLDGNGAVVGEEDIFARSELTKNLPGEGERTRFFRGHNEKVGQIDYTIIPVEGDVAALEITALNADPGILSVDIRIQERLPAPEGEAVTDFLRRSPQEQRELARANAFPPELISEQERANIMINRWQPQGPSGVAGRDYRVLVLYEAVSRSAEQEPAGE